MRMNRSAWGTPEEVERRNRIKILLWACAYDFENDSLVDDATFDRAARLINLEQDTDRADLDDWFRREFTTDTGMWIRGWPEVDKLAALYRSLTRTRE